MRVGAAVTPPLQAADGSGSVPSNVRDQTTYPVSLSSMYSLFELPATSDAGTKSVTPLARHSLREAVEPAALVVEFRRPLQLEPGLRHRLDGDVRVGLQPGRALGIGVGRGPVRPAASDLGERHTPAMSDAAKSGTMR
jgi:hypothetical protein